MNRRTNSNNWIILVEIIITYAAAVILCSTSNGPTFCRILSIVIMIGAATVVLFKKIIKM